MLSSPLSPAVALQHRSRLEISSLFLRMFRHVNDVISNFSWAEINETLDRCRLARWYSLNIATYAGVSSLVARI